MQFKEGHCILFFRPRTRPKTFLQCFALDSRCFSKTLHKCLRTRPRTKKLDTKPLFKTFQNLNKNCPSVPFSRNFLLIHSPNYLVYWSRFGSRVKVSSNIQPYHLSRGLKNDKTWTIRWTICNTTFSTCLNSSKLTIWYEMINLWSILTCLD